MPGLALALLALYGLLGVVLRIAVQRRRTGSTGFKGIRGASGAVERIGGLLYTAAVVLAAAGPALEEAGALHRFAALSGTLAEVLGIVLAALGIVLTSAAQFAMGDSWRIGVDPSERTALVTDGPFAVVRNPIYAVMIPFFFGVAFLAPNAVTIIGAALVFVSLEMQVRFTEEPHLVAVHGEAYVAYASKVGRFLPGVGRGRGDGERVGEQTDGEDVPAGT
jgi:protein-S-isoprenylcysteine O-methyltransferase Ste14